MSDERIKKRVEDTLSSFDGAGSAEPKAFLYTRVIAAINNRPSSDNMWVRLGAFISKPSIAFGGLLLIVILNAAILLNRDGSKENVAQGDSAFRDEFALSTTTFYQLENIEP